uniref:Protein CASC3 n=1 Tax=Timema cristinae TaxID=61476 RepID=A0A7R9DIB0_TIMCR|nr:unnamed protein product [Timema cristinae]
MSQVQRRRTVRLSGDSEEFSESSYDDADFVKGSEGEIDLNANREGQRESAYEKAEPHEENGTDEDQGTPGEDDDLSDSVIIEYEREDGDGQESVPSKEKKLDDDEDRRNPQYIPKRGTFYEHDDRTAEVDE